MKKMKFEKEYLTKWQNIIDMMAELINIPAGLIMRIDEEEIKVLLASRSDGNPYNPGDKETLLNSGLYCETVIKSDDELLVPDARVSEQWKDNPDMKINMYSYLGYPIHNPDKTVFGTLCVLDNKENLYSDSYKKVMLNLREIIENDIKISYMNSVLGDKSKGITDYIAEIKESRDLLRVCAGCKDIKDDDDNWIQIEQYIKKHNDADITHSLCNKCAEDLYGIKV